MFEKLFGYKVTKHVSEKGVKTSPVQRNKKQMDKKTNVQKNKWTKNKWTNKQVNICWLLRKVDVGYYDYQSGGRVEEIIAGDKRTVMEPGLIIMA